ncbi:MAG TPA: NAD(P)-dependent oxidoreductase [Streptosporangiaceae bacterium]|nr:NAD(P)-dependent oxidoreductase [Streptosporangiaceae bacterium]
MTGSGIATGDRAGRTVLVTGSAGRVGGFLRAALPAAGWRLRLLDRVPTPGADDAIVADIGDRNALDRAMDGVCAVVHLAAAAGTDASFDDVKTANIAGTYEVMTAACRAGVPRMIFASSNHANGFAPCSAPARPGLGDRPDSYYGVSKLFGEALGRLYADRFGLRVACLRIGSCRERPHTPRALATWLSPADLVRLVTACLTDERLGYAVVYGISRNTRRWWDLAPGEAIGYHPRDDAEDFAAEVLAPFGGEWPLPADARQGGDAAWSAT